MIFPLGSLRPLLARICAIACLVTPPAFTLHAAATTDVAELLRAADDALKKKDYGEAVQLAGKAIAADPKDFRPWLLRGRAHEESREFARAVADYDAGLKLNPKATLVYQRRGEAHFRLGHFKESIADFDKFIELMPEQSPHHWQRGIALYYDGRFEDGRKQFEHTRRSTRMMSRTPCGISSAWPALQASRRPASRSSPSSATPACR